MLNCTYFTPWTIKSAVYHGFVHSLLCALRQFCIRGKCLRAPRRLKEMRRILAHLRIVEVGQNTALPPIVPNHRRSPRTAGRDNRHTGRRSRGTEREFPSIHQEQDLQFLRLINLFHHEISPTIALPKHVHKRPTEQP